MSAISLQGNAGGTGTLSIAAPSTNTNQTLTLPDQTGTFAVLTDGIGYSQTWQQPSPRAIGTTYTNSTGKPIQVAISGAPTTTTGGSLILTVGGIAITGNLGVATGSGLVSIQAIVPVGATYVATYSLSGGLSSVVWNELR